MVVWKDRYKEDTSEIVFLPPTAQRAKSEHISVYQSCANQTALPVEGARGWIHMAPIQF